MPKGLSHDEVDMLVSLLRQVLDDVGTPET
jgi:hypothetical protein